MMVEPQPDVDAAARTLSGDSIDVVRSQVQHRVMASHDNLADWTRRDEYMQKQWREE